MARKTTRNPRRRSSRRRSRRNPKYVIANGRRRRGRRVRRNQEIFGADIVQGIAIPVLGAAVGFIGARYLGNMVALKDWGTTDPKLAKTAAAAIGIPLTFVAARRLPIVARNSGAIVLGMGLAAAEAWLRDTPLLGGSPAAAALAPDMAPAPSPAAAAPAAAAPAAAAPAAAAPAATSGLASYYDYPLNAEGQAALSDDYYTATMLGDAGDPANQAEVEGALDSMETGGNGTPQAVSTVTPTDMAMRANTMPQWSEVRENFANRGDRGHAGGMFSRHLFSGMMGS